MGVWDLGTLDPTSPFHADSRTRGMSLRNLTIGTFRYIPSPRLDVRRLLRIAYASNEQGEEAISHFLPGMANSLVPGGIPDDDSFL